MAIGPPLGASGRSWGVAGCLPPKGIGVRACVRVLCSVEICMNFPWRKRKKTSMKAQRKTKAAAFSSPTFAFHVRVRAIAIPPPPAGRAWWRCEMETRRNAPAPDGALVRSPPWRAPASCPFRALPLCSVPAAVALARRRQRRPPSWSSPRRHPTWHPGPIQTPRPRRAGPPGRWFAAPPPPRPCPPASPPAAPGAYSDREPVPAGLAGRPRGTGGIISPEAGAMPPAARGGPAVNRIRRCCPRRVHFLFLFSPKFRGRAHARSLSRHGGSGTSGQRAPSPSRRGP